MTDFTKSYKILEKVHPDLGKVVGRSRGRVYLLGDGLEFIVTEGLRTTKRQEELVAAGASRTLRSRHLTGHAVDLAATVNGKIRWDWPLYKKIADLMKMCAAELTIPIVWGGDWRTFKDGPHFELPRDRYPE